MTKKLVLWLIVQSSLLSMSFANNFSISSVFVKQGTKENSYKIAVEATIKMSPGQIETLENGIPLTFSYTLVVEEKIGILWFSGNNAPKDYDYTIAYNALTQQYVVNTHHNQKYENFPTLSLALSYISEPKNLNLQVIDRKDNRPYRAGVRLKLDINALPTPLRVPAYLSSDWNLDTGWKYWELTPW